MLSIGRDKDPISVYVFGFYDFIWCSFFSIGLDLEKKLSTFSFLKLPVACNFFYINIFIYKPRSGIGQVFLILIPVMKIFPDTLSANGF